MADAMDPSTWPLIVKLLCGWGPLGAWAAIAEMRRRGAEASLAKSEASHHVSRDMCAKSLAAVVERHETAIAATRDRHEEAMTEMRDAHISTVKEMTEEHQLQLHEVTKRMLRLIERQSEKVHALADKVDERAGGPGDRMLTGGRDGTPP